MIHKKVHSIMLYLVLVSLSTCASNNSKHSQLTNVTEDEINIYLGSCNRQFMSQDFWSGIADNAPDVWLWLGDNIYADNTNYVKRTAAYNVVKNHPGYQKLLQQSMIIGTWDDHDYGTNDADQSYPGKKESQKAHLEFFNIPNSNPVWQQQGIYRMHQFKKNGITIDFILLDARYFKNVDQGIMLGNQQWKWLNDILNDGSDNLTIIASGSPILTSDTSSETWERTPNERNKLLDLVKNSSRKIILSSGDKHYSEFSSDRGILEMTISGMTHLRNRIAPNQHRITEPVVKKNFAQIKIKIDPQTSKIIKVTMSINDISDPTSSFLHFDPSTVNNSNLVW